MKPLRLALLSLMLLLTSTATSSASLPNTERFLTIASGSISGVYYPTGRTICNLINKERKHHAIRCNVLATSGSIYNLNKLRTGEMEMGLVQSDWLYSSFHGIDNFLDQGADPDLTVLFLPFSEAFTVAVRADSGIHSIQDLLGKRVSMGTPSTGSYDTMLRLIKVLGWTLGDFKEVRHLKPSEQPHALCNGTIDASINALAHPNAAIQESSTSCEIKLIPLSGEYVNRFLKEYPYYFPMTIPGKIYPGNEEETQTFGMKAVLVANKRMDEEAVYQVVKSVFDNYDYFKEFHPVFKQLGLEGMVQPIHNIPFHEGALRFFKEKGIR